jgi:hypothetical protein
MDRRQFFEYARAVMDVLGQGKLHVPIGKPDDAGEVSFGRFGLDSPGAAFRTAWEFTAQDSSSAAELRAFVTGSIRYDGGTANRIVLQNLDALGELTRREHLPAWFPLPKFVIYEGVDEDAMTALILEYLSDHGNVRRAVELSWGPSVLPSELAERFVAGTLEIPVPAGRPIGIAKRLDAATRAVRIAMQVVLDDPDGLYLDPALYHEHWASHFADLSGHPLETDLRKIWAGPGANGTVRYVRRDGGSTGPYTDPAAPARLVSLAAAEAGPHDTILVLDTETYSESGQIEIDKPLTITSLAEASVVAAADPPTLATLDGGGTHRMFWIREDAGLVTLANIAITGGAIDTDPVSTSGIASDGLSPAGGGGIVVDRNDQTYIRNCHIHHNTLVGFRGHHEGDYSAEEGTDESNFGAGIFVFHSSPLVFRNRIVSNHSDRRGGGIGLWGYGWPTIAGNLIALNHADKDGGAVGIEVAVPDHDLVGIVSLDLGWSDEHIEQARITDVKFLDNQIVGNNAGDDGGGVYLSVMTSALFSGNTIQANVAGGAGGGIRASFGSAVAMQADEVANNQCRQPGGGGIACRDSQLSLRDVLIQENSVQDWAGGGVAFLSSTEGSPISGTDPAISDVYDDILREVFRPSQFEMRTEGTTRITQNRCRPGTGADHRKGGGVYALRAQVGAFVALPFKLAIDDIGRIDGNLLEGPPDPTFPASAQLHIEDQVNRPGQPVDDTNLADFAASDGIIYESA